MLAIQESCQIKNSKFLSDSVIYTTLEPCMMCAAAISEARIKKIYFGAYDEKKGAIDNGIKIFNSIGGKISTEKQLLIESKLCKEWINKSLISK